MPSLGGYFQGLIRLLRYRKAKPLWILPRLNMISQNSVQSFSGYSQGLIRYRMPSLGEVRGNGYSHGMSCCCLSLRPFPWSWRTANLHLALPRYCLRVSKVPLGRPEGLLCYHEKAEVCSSFRTLPRLLNVTVQEQCPRSHHKGRHR